MQTYLNQHPNKHFKRACLKAINLSKQLGAVYEKKERERFFFESSCQSLEILI